MQQLVERLQAVLPELDATAIAEAVWLAALRQAETGSDFELRSLEVSGTGEEEGQLPATPAETAPASGDDTGPNAGRRGLYDTPATGERGPAIPGQLARIRRAYSLPRPLDLVRSLRPFTQRWPIGRHAELDLDQTVNTYGRTRQLIPVFRPAPERWFEVALVVDESPSMAVWDEVISELRLVLQQVGAFRLIRMWRLSFDTGAPRLRDASGQEYSHHQLRSPDGRRLILVASDFCADGWRDELVWQVLRAWATSTPTTLVSPFPTRLWRRTGLNLPAVNALAARPGARNDGLRFEVPLLLRLASDRTDWLPLPAITLTPHSLGRWSRALMRNHPGGCDAMLAAPPGQPADTPGEHPDEMDGPRTPEALVDTFQLLASPAAIRLAVLSSAHRQLSLPHLALIRQELIPEATVGDVAELIVGGLVSAERDAKGQPLLRFRDGVQAKLRTMLTHHDAWQMVQALSRYAAAQAGHPMDQEVLVADPRGNVSISRHAQPFAEAADELLRLLGIDSGHSAVAADQEPVHLDDEPDAILPAPPAGSPSSPLAAELTLERSATAHQPQLAAALAEAATLQSERGRHELLERLRRRLGYPAEVSSADPLRWSRELVNAAARDPGGTRALVAEIEQLEGQTETVLALHRMLDELEASDELLPQDWELRHALTEVRTANLSQLYQRAADYHHPPPPWCNSAWHMFVNLACLNPTSGGLPPSMAFLASLEREVDADLADRLRLSNQRRATSLDLTAALDQARHRRDPDFHPLSTAYLVVVIEPDLDPAEITSGMARSRLAREGQYRVSVVRQWRDSDTWRSEQDGTTHMVGRDDLEALMRQAVSDMETVWAESARPVVVEVVLPIELLDMDVAWWRIGDNPPVALAKHYPVVVRSLERLRTRRWHPSWRNRWLRLQEWPGRTTVYSARPPGGSSSPPDLEHATRLEATLLGEEQFVGLVLSQPPTTELGQQELRAGLRAGCPIIIWNRNEHWDSAAVAPLTTHGSMTKLPTLTAELRREALRLDPAEQERHIGRNIVLLWDDPERLIGLTGPSIDQPLPVVSEVAAPSTRAEPLGVVFVHGFSSSADAWSGLLSLLQQDPDLPDLDLRTFEYGPRVALRLLRRIPDLNDLADRLWTYLNDELAGRERLVLVTHSQGGLVVQRMLARLLIDGRGRELARIRQIVMFACPGSGSELMLSLRSGGLSGRLLEQVLRSLNETILETQRLVVNRIVHATAIADDQCMIPIRSYVGAQDRLVSPANNSHLEVGLLPGDHFSIIKPDSTSSRSYTALKLALTNALASGN